MAIEVRKPFSSTRKLHPSIIVDANLGSREPHRTFESTSLQFWKLYFRVSYYLLLLPFRVCFNPVTGLWELKKWKVQQVAVLINNLVIGFYFVLQLRRIIVKANDPGTYFEIASFVCDTLYLQLMLNIFGRKGDEMLRLFNNVQGTSFKLFPSRSSRDDRKTIVASYVICFLAFSCVVLAALESCHDSSWDLHSTYNSFEANANDVLHDILPLQQTSQKGQVPVLMVLLGFWAMVYERLMNAFSDVLFTMTALWFHSLAEAFVSIVADDSGSQPEQVIACYREIKRIVEQASVALALITGSFVIGNLPFYVKNVFQLFSDRNIFLRLRYLIYCSYYFPSLFLAARASRQMEVMKAWVSKVSNVRHLTLLEATLLVSEVSTQPVELDSFGCFHVNFSLLGSIISVIITYALVRSQLSGSATA